VKTAPMQTIQVNNAQDWNSQLRSLPAAHILQTWQWGEFKASTTGWTPQRQLFFSDQGQLLAAASILTRRIGPLRVMYVPKGPIFAAVEPALIALVLDYLQQLARQRGAIWLKIDPDIPIATGLPADVAPDPSLPDCPDARGQAVQALLRARRWRFSNDQVQFRNTLTLDLTQPEDALLAGMSQSTRRKIRQAEKAGVVVRDAHDDHDLQALYKLYTITGQRQGFTIRPWRYYHDLWTSFRAAKLAHFLLAEHESNLLAGVILFHFGQRAWYFYGMSANDQRDMQPNYALHWAAIRWSKAQGYRVYDWWGAPDHFSEQEPMWGVYRFKRGFGSQVVRTIGAWDYAPYRGLYWLYMQAIPRVLGWMQRKATKTE
jgi:peptidoglycan pentaglycine glycine transferase (the first glycine)